MVKFGWRGHALIEVPIDELPDDAKPTLSKVPYPPRRMDWWRAGDKMAINGETDFLTYCNSEKKCGRYASSRPVSRSTEVQKSGVFPALVA